MAAGELRERKGKEGGACIRPELFEQFPGPVET